MFKKFSKSPQAPMPVKTANVKERKEAGMTMSPKFRFVIVLVLIPAIAILVGLLGYRAVDGAMAKNDAARIAAEAGLAKEQAEMYRGQAEMYRGLSEAYKTEADKWRGYGAAVSSWAEPLNVFPKTLGAVALVLIALGTALGVGRLLWGMGRSGEVYVAAAVEVKKQQALLYIEQQRQAALQSGQATLLPAPAPAAQIPAEVQTPAAEKPKTLHKFVPGAGVPGFMKGRVPEVKDETPTSTEK